MLLGSVDIAMMQYPETPAEGGRVWRVNNRHTGSFPSFIIQKSRETQQVFVSVCLNYLCSPFSGRLHLEAPLG